MKTPNVVSFAANDAGGQPVRFTLATDIIDHIEPARAFGREDLADPQASGRFQRRVIAIPDRKPAVVSPMVLTIGSQNGLYLVRRDERAAGGWALIDLGGRFAGGAPVRAVGAMWTDDDRIALAVAVDDGPNPSRSRVFVAYNLSSRTSDWEQLDWIDCGARDGVRVDGIRVLDAGDGSWTVVLSGDRGPNDTLYLLRSTAAQSLAQALVFSPAMTLDEILDFEVGVHPIYGGGVHLLGITNGKRVLTFRPFPEYDAAGRARTIPPVVPLPCPPGANVLESGLTGPDGSDLYIGGQGVYQIAAAELGNSTRAQVIQVAAPQAAPAVQDVVIGDRPDGSAAAWTLLQNGDLNIVKRAAGGGWGAPLRLREGVQEIAPVPGDHHVTTSLLVVYADSRAAYIWQDAGTGVWQEAPIVVANPEHAISVRCYSTSLRVLDAAGAPRADVPVSVSASVLSSVCMNGNSVFIGPVLPVTTRTDINGAVSLFDRVRSLTPAVYRVAIEGIDGVIDINPAGSIHARFQSMTADELRNATISTPQGPAPLLPESFRNGTGSAQVDAVVAALNQAAGLARSTDGVASGARLAQAGAHFSSVLSVAALPDGYRWGIQADARGVRAADGGVIDALVGAAESAAEFFTNLGETIVDFFEGIGRRIKEGVTFVLHKAEQAFEFICALGDKIKRFVLTTLEQIGAFFTWLWEQIETGLERLWDYLKFIFDWKDILRVRRAMVDATDDALQYLQDSVDTFKEQAAQGFDQALAQVRRWRAEAGAPPARPRRPGAGQSALDAISTVTAPAQQVLDQITGNSVVSWVFGQLDSVVSEIITIEGPNPAEHAIQAAEQFAAGLLSDEVDNLLAGLEQIQADVVRLFDGKAPSPAELSFETIKDVLITLGVDVLDGLLTGMRALVLRTLDLMRELIGVMRDLIFVKIRFPFIEKLVELVAPGADLDTSFRLIDALMLLLAVPATIGYKIIFDEPPLREGQEIGLPFGGSVMVQSGADDLRRFTMIAGLVGAFGKMAHASILAIQTTRTYRNTREGFTPGWFFKSLGVDVNAFGFAIEALSIRFTQGTPIHALDMTMALISAIVPLKGAALLIWPLRADNSSAKKISAGFDIACFLTHFALKTAAYGVAVDGVLHSDDKEDDKEILTETLAWLEDLFDRAIGLSLLTAADLVQDPKAKAILIGSGAGGRGVGLVLNLTRVITQHVM